MRAFEQALEIPRNATALPGAPDITGQDFSRATPTWHDWRETLARRWRHTPQAGLAMRWLPGIMRLEALAWIAISFAMASASFPTGACVRSA